MKVAESKPPSGPPMNDANKGMDLKVKILKPGEDTEMPSNGVADTDISEDSALLAGMSKTPKEVPCSYLYDDVGSALYNQITELEEYYPFKTELTMLKEHSPDIITHIPPGAVLVELGCGSAEKTAALQAAMLSRDGPESCTFVGIDVSAEFLGQAKSNLLSACPEMQKERVETIQATYMRGVREARKRHPDEVLCILWLGSSIGNLAPGETLTFFRDLLEISGPKTEVLVCTDLWKDIETLHRAYDDSKGVTKAFILNGMKNAIKAATNGRTVINEEKWHYDVVVNCESRQVEMYVNAGEQVEIGQGIEINEGERILMEVSRKFQVEQLRGLAFQSGLYLQAQWANPMYSIQLLCSPSMAYTLAWRDTDDLFARLRDWNACPIELRHPFLFYHGHIASFAKTRLTKDAQPSEWDIMFSRGIDPDVSDPSHCHEHPEAPHEWPSKTEVIQYTMQTREEMMSSLASGVVPAHVGHLSLEHERLHQETLCYMLAQQEKQEWHAAHVRADGTLLENGAAFDESLARWGKGMGAGGLTHKPKMETSYVDIPRGKTTLGADFEPGRGFMWDNEGPKKEAEMVEAFCVASHPVSIGAFMEFVTSATGYSTPGYWQASHYELFGSKQSCPANWTITEEGDIWVHYPEGTWHWSQVQHRPVWCSLAEAKAYCCFKDARVMTEAEYTRILSFDPTHSRVKLLQSEGWEMTSSAFMPFPGFKPMVDYPEYSADFFDGKHFVLKGASPYTHPSAARASFRNFYQDVYPYVFAKFRCCQSA